MSYRWEMFALLAGKLANAIFFSIFGTSMGHWHLTGTGSEREERQLMITVLAFIIAVFYA